MTVAAKWLRRFEIALTVVGTLLIGVAVAATVYRWNYQARQERAIFHGSGAVAPIHSESAAAPIHTDRAATSILTDSAIAPIQHDGAVTPLPADPAIDPLALGRIEIPRIGVTAIVREGADDETLALAVGHVLGTARPGEAGNTVLAGHRDTFFRGLRNIRMNDRVRIVTPPRSFEYRVVSLGVIKPEETRVLDQTSYEALTLVTCYPFQFVGHAPNRFIVRAARVE